MVAMGIILTLWTKHEMKIKTFMSYSSTHWDKEQSLMDLGIWTCSYSSFSISIFIKKKKSMTALEYFSQWRQQHQKISKHHWTNKKRAVWTWLWDGLESFISPYALIKLETSSSFNACMVMFHVLLLVHFMLKSFLGKKLKGFLAMKEH